MKHPWITLCVAWATLSACTTSSTAYDPYYYDSAYYDTYYYGYDTAYMYGWYDDYGVYYASGTIGQPLVDLNAAASSIAARTSTFFTPSGCVSSTASGASVTSVFSDCTGAFGATGITGTVIVNLAENGNALVFTATSSGLKIGGRPYNLAVLASGTTSGNTKTLTVTSRSRDPERVDSRSSDAIITWEKGSGCVEIDGTTTSSMDSLSTTTTITDYKRCANQCPTAGTIKVTGERGDFSGTFDGGKSLKVVGPNDSSKDFDLKCQ